MDFEAPQFNVSNTMPDTILEQVSVIMQPPADSGLTEDFIIPVPSLMSSNSPGIVYVSFTREAPEEYVTASLSCMLKFISKEMDPATGEPEVEGYEDEYQLEEVELAAGGDYIIPNYSNFSSEWDRLRTGASMTETFTLSSMESIKGVAVTLSAVLSCIDAHWQRHAILLSRYSTWNPWAGLKMRHQERQFIHYSYLVC
jgi:coatomer protein complex subunit gamma